MASRSLSDYWNLLINEYNIIDEINNNAVFEITSDEINKYKQARIMTKFDFHSQIPKALKDNDISILPVSNGKYLLGRFSLYQSLPKPKDEECESLELPYFIETIDPDNIYSEANALHVALITGMLKKFVNEKELYQTISGRMRPEGFSFSVDIKHDNLSSFNIDIERPQIEIDGGYEGDNIVVLIEAKKKQPKDFIIRQLYYPLRYWSNKVSKDIKTIFLTYDSGIYRLYDYKFEDINYYNSLKLINQKSYVVKYPNTEKTLFRIWNECTDHLIDDNYLDVQFPQADSFTRVIELLYLAQQNNFSAKEAGEWIEYSERQGKYYIDAGIYLGLFRYIKKGCYGITEFGIQLLEKNVRIRNQQLAKKILSHEIFYYTFQHYLENNELLSIKETEELLKKYVTNITSNETYHRRSSTIIGWLRWIINCNL